MTEEDGTTGAVEQLAWGTYYFLETKAPQGYEMSTEKHTFTVDASNAGSVQTLQVSNEKIKGSVALTKMDEATKTKKLPDAQFNLYKNDGSGKLGGTTKTTKEFTIQGETVQIFFRSDGSGSNYYGFYAVVEAEVQKTEIVAGKEKQPDHVMKTFAGWYTNAACSDGKEFTLQNCTESTIVYAKWKDPTAVLLDSDYNTGLSKKFADIAETPETITAFQRSAIMPDANITNEAHCISTENSEVPVYLWKDGTTLKWWSKAVSLRRKV